MTDGRPALKRVIHDTSLESLEEGFVEAVSRARGLDPLAPLTVIVGSNLQHIYLRRLLARTRGAVANIRFLTLLDLAGEVHMAAAPNRPLEPLPEGGEGLLVGAIFREQGLNGPDSPLSTDAKGLAEAVSSTIKDLREGRVQPQAVRKSASGSRKLQALAAVYEQFQARVAEFVDRTSLFESAISATGEAVGRAVAGPVLVYGIYELNAVQLALLMRLSTGRDVTFFLPWREGEASFEFSGALVRDLRSVGFEVALSETVDSASDAGCVMFSGSDRHAEAEEVVRRVLTDVEDGVPLSEIAVLHHLDQSYDELLAGVLERARLPFYLASGRPVRRTAVGKASLMLVDLLCGEPTRGRLLELLSLPCIDLSWIEAGLTPRPGSWEILSKDFGLVKGWDDFLRLLDVGIEVLQNAEREPWQERRLENAGTLRSVVAALGREASRSKAMPDWTSMTTWLIELLQKTLLPSRDAEAVEAIKGRLEVLGTYDRLGIPCTTEVFRDSAETGIRRATLRGGYFQRDGVFLGSVGAARWLRFRRVYLLECAERVFPPVIRQDPILLDDERRDINMASGVAKLPVKARRLSEERLLFEIARQSASERLTLSYSRRTELSGPPRLPSGMLLEQATRITGGFKSVESIEHESPPWFQRLPSRVGFHGRAPDDALRALDASDLRYHVLDRAGAAGVPSIEQLWPGIDDVRRFRRERSARRFGAFDGIVPAHLVAESGVLDQDLSATGLSAYAVCPYRFFLSRVLGVQPNTEPEEALEIDPAERGSFVHRVLERFARLAIDNGRDWKRLLDEGKTPLREVLEEEAGKLPRRSKGLPFTWQIDLEEIEEDLLEYLIQERRRAEAGWRPVGVEQEFRRVALSAGSGRLMMRGLIDRVDRSSESLRVVDYKTGQARETKLGYQKGEHLQLPMYLMAACAENGEPLQGSRAEFHHVSRRGKFETVTLTGDELAADERFPVVLQLMFEGIASGNFFYWPGAEGKNCKFCDFETVCHGQVERYMTRKAPGSADLTTHWKDLRQG